MHLSKHFTLDEFVASDTAQRLGIDNAIPSELLQNAAQTCEMLERIRSHLRERAMRSAPITITSGYRCLALNRALRSSDSSDHVLGAAADIRSVKFGSAFDVAECLAEAADLLGIGQIIYEFDSWVHVSTRTPARSINRILTINKNGTTPGIVRDA